MNVKIFAKKKNISIIIGKVSDYLIYGDDQSDFTPDLVEIIQGKSREPVEKKSKEQERSKSENNN